MKRLIISNVKNTLGLVLGLCVAFSSVSAQGLPDLLEGIEQNNLALKVKRNQTSAQVLEAKVGNSLANPSIDYEQMWGGGTGESLSKGEFGITQQFDLPNVYAHRNRLAREKASMYGFEYSLARQQILLQAKSAYIELVYLTQMGGVAKRRLSHGEQIASNFAKRLDAGDANIIEKQRADIELKNMRIDFDLLIQQREAVLAQLRALNGGVDIVLHPEAAADYIAPSIASSIEELVAEYEARDPQMRLLNSQIVVAGREVQVSRGASLPQLALGYKHDFGPGERFNGMTVGLSVPMFGNRNNVKRAKAQQLYAQSELVSAQSDVRSALSELLSRSKLLRASLEQFGWDADNHAGLLRKALDAGQITVGQYYTELDVYYSTVEKEMSLVRDYNMVCAQIDAVKL